MFSKQFVKLAVSVLLLGSSFSVMSATTYQVKLGDTLNSIAEQFNVNTKYLMEINNLNAQNTIKVGDLLIINDSVALSYPGKTVSYTVQPGDRLGNIAKKFDTTTTILAELNPSLKSNFDNIYVGQKLIVPQTSNVIQPTNNTTSIATAKANVPVVTQVETTRQYTGKNFVYTVQRNDTFTGIANRFNVKAADLAKANNVDATYKVKTGETLYVPEIVDGLRDTTTSKETNTKEKSKKETAKTSKETNKTKELGPAAKKNTKTSEPAPVNTNKANSPLQIDSFKYEVKSGDTLLGLAKRYNVTLSTLAELNHLKTDSKLKTGQKILVPVVK